jgi:hypothetical protein
VKQKIVIMISIYFVLSLITVGFIGAASIPVWLDDAITNWNDKTPNVQIAFLDIKDSYVWYMIPDTEEINSTDIRNGVFNLAIENGYKITAEEELVTTGKPPSPTAPYREKKCWTRSFVLDVEELSNTKAVGSNESGGIRQRMLTSMVCEDSQYWYAGFRILQ